MKKLHSNAALTIPQRIEVKRLFEIENVSVSELARRFCVGELTIRKWIKRDSPEDRSSAPKRKREVVTDDYKQAVIEYRRFNPVHGARRIAFELKDKYAIAHRGTVSVILQTNGLTKKSHRVKTKWKIPVGRHRLQCDVQQLPAIKGNEGFEYKISFIHLKTRYKYSEIHSDQKSETISQVYQRALDNLPPFS